MNALAATARAVEHHPGYGRLKEETFRIGHMGDQTMDTLEPLLEALEDVFR